MRDDRCKCSWVGRLCIATDLSIALVSSPLDLVSDSQRSLVAVVAHNSNKLQESYGSGSVDNRCLVAVGQFGIVGAHTEYNQVDKE